MKIVIDRIEGNYAVCQDLESKKMIDILLDVLPTKVQEGDVLILNNNKYIISKQDKEKRNKRIREKMVELMKKNS